MKYFISYEIKDRRSWFILDRDEPICTEDDIYEIMVDIRDDCKYNDNIVVLGWQKMELPE